MAFAIFAFISLILWGRRLPEAVVGMLSAGYVNANNIGIPVAVYVLGDAAHSAPIILLQLLIFTPISLAILDASTAGAMSWRAIIMQPLRNPIIVGSALGLVLAVTDVSPPDAAMEPFRIIGAAAVPLMLISYGMSLHGQKPLRAGQGRRDVLVASFLKLIVMPAAAWVLGALVFDLTGHDLFVVVALAALPAAQNVFNYAQRYDRGEAIARDAILLTTIGSIPVLILLAAVLH